MKILIIKTSAFGDIVHTFPAVQFIKQCAPDATLDWVVEKGCAPLVEAHPLVNQVHVIQTKKWRKSLFSSAQEIKEAIQGIRSSFYDVVFDFQGNTKSGIIMGLAHAKTKVGFGKKTVPEFPNLFFSNLRFDPTPGLNIREDYLALVEGWRGKKGTIQQTILKVNENLGLQRAAGKNILVCPGSNWSNKQLPIKPLAQFLNAEEPCKFWILQNSQEEKALAETLQSMLKNAEVMPSLSLPLLQAWMREMDLVVGMDSLPLHLAAEAGVPTYSFFGPSLAAKYKPLGPLHQAIQGTCPYARTFAKRCPLLRTCQTGACLKDLQR